MLELEQLQAGMLVRDQCGGSPVRLLQCGSIAGDARVLWCLDAVGNRVSLVVNRAEAGRLEEARDLVALPADPVAVRACLLAGAVGDALGAPVEFLDWPHIRRQFGSRGIQDPVPAYGCKGAITDDTQMLLFTAEGLLRAACRHWQRGRADLNAVIHHALLRWLHTQGERSALPIDLDGWLVTEAALHVRRAPGNTCLSALRQSLQPGQPARNHSKGCGGVMRVAPCAFVADPFRVASDSARLTHGHPSGYLAAGLFADILSRLWRERLPLQTAIEAALQEHGRRPGMDECRLKLQQVLALHAAGIVPQPESIAALGGGWVAEEALAIGLWCALQATSLEDGIVTAVNHSGDSDSTGLIAGHLLGLMYGEQAIPRRWLDVLELRAVITRVADDLAVLGCPDWLGCSRERLLEQYPAWWIRAIALCLLSPVLPGILVTQTSATSSYLRRQVSIGAVPVVRVRPYSAAPHGPQPALGRRGISPHPCCQAFLPKGSSERLMA